MTTDQTLILESLCAELAALRAENAAHLIANAEARLNPEPPTDCPSP